MNITIKETVEPSCIINIEISNVSKYNKKHLYKCNDLSGMDTSFKTIDDILI